MMIVMSVLIILLIFIMDGIVNDRRIVKPFDITSDTPDKVDANYAHRDNIEFLKLVNTVSKIRSQPRYITKSYLVKSWKGDTRVSLNDKDMIDIEADGEYTCRIINATAVDSIYNNDYLTKLLRDISSVTAFRRSGDLLVEFIKPMEHDIGAYKLRIEYTYVEGNRL